MTDCRICSVNRVECGTVCLDCVDVLRAMIWMSETSLLPPQPLSQQCNAPEQRQQKKQQQETRKIKKTRGLTIEKMLQRIVTHWLFARLAWSVQERIRYVGRFDYRRNKCDNDYVRDVYYYLTEQSAINVY